MERITSQKKIILDFLKETKAHPSAEKVYFEVKKKLPQISLATVYRVLNNLKKKGKVREICCRVSHFDGDTSEHIHFICQECDQIFDIFEKIDFQLKNKTKVGKINNCQVCFYGVCKNCSSKK